MFMNRSMTSDERKSMPDRVTSTSSSGAVIPITRNETTGLTRNSFQTVETPVSNMPTRLEYISEVTRECAATGQNLYCVRKNTDDRASHVTSRLLPPAL